MEPRPAQTDRFEAARALIWQERQERIYAARILKGILYRDLEPAEALHAWAHRVLMAHAEAEADE